MTTTTLLAASMAVYLGIMLGIGFWARGKVHDAEDFFVAGRRLPLSMAWATLLATWFGAGTLLAAVDEVSVAGLRAAALEPVGPGLCLIIAGLVFARPLWEMKLVTMADFYQRTYGRRAEVVFSFTVLGYLGWIGAQLVAMAGILGLFFDLSPWISIVATAAIAMAYTLLGGMWSVTLTDTLQVVLLLVGLVIIGYEAFTLLGDGSLAAGLARIPEVNDAERLRFIPAGDAKAFMGWLSVLAVGTLGNVTGTDLMQRVFSAKSPGVAQGACLLGGVAYIVFGAIPILLALVAPTILPADLKTSVLPALAQKLLSPGLTILFVLTLMSAVLSTLDSAILAPASVIANNVLRPMIPAQRIDTLRLTHLCVIGVSVLAVVLALIGESAYSLLESSYALDLAAVFVPMTMGLFRKKVYEGAALASMGVGVGVWALELVLLHGFGHTLESPIPIPLLAATASLVAYLLVERVIRAREESA